MESSFAVVSPIELEEQKCPPLQTSFDIDSKSPSSLQDYTASGNDRTVAHAQNRPHKDENVQRDTAFPPKGYFQVDDQFNAWILTGQKPKRTKKIAHKKSSQFYMDHSVRSHNLRFLIIPTSPTRRQDFYVKPDYFRDVVSDCEEEEDDDDSKDQEVKDLKSTPRRPRRTSERLSKSSSLKKISSASVSDSSSDKGDGKRQQKASSSTTTHESTKISNSQAEQATKSNEGNASPKTSLDALFEKHVATLVQYKDQHGDYDVPSRYPPNQPLSNWVSNINYSYNLIKRGYPGTIRLSEKRLSVLKEIGYKFKDMNVRIKADSTTQVNRVK